MGRGLTWRTRARREGYFGYGGKSFVYSSDQYAENVPYTKLQPHDKRKLGFGTHDAHKRDEFTQSIRTQQCAVCVRLCLPHNCLLLPSELPAHYEWRRAYSTIL
jgi:hypothetical protein